MQNLTKLLIGGAVTSLLAWGSHAATGERFVGGLHASSQSALQSAGLDSIKMVPAGTEGYLSRIISLSGDGVDTDTRAAAETAITGAVPGVSRIVWTGADATASAGAPAAPAVTEEQVADCQSGVDGVMAGKEITFQSGSAYMSPESLRVVDELAAKLSECGGMNVAVGGHTDATGRAAYNQTLSQQRAEAVVAALGERGIASERVTATGHGSSKPKIEGAGPEANAANRRIEFTISSGASAPTAASATAEGE